MSGVLDLLSSPAGQQLISGMARETGQPENKTADVLSMAMPLLLGAMKKNVADPESEDDRNNGLLGSMLGGQPEQNQSLIMSLIDADNDGSVLDDVADMVIVSSKKKGGPGSILGSLFGN